MSVQVTTLYKSSSASVLAASSDQCSPNWSKEAASAAADDELYRVETCADPCGLNRSKEAASTAADDDLYRVETCTNPCGRDRSKEAGSTAADDEFYSIPNSKVQKSK